MCGSKMFALVALSFLSDNVTFCALMRSFNLNCVSWVYMDTFSNINAFWVLWTSDACMVIKPLSEDSRNHILLSINCKLSEVIAWVLIFTE